MLTTVNNPNAIPILLVTEPDFDHWRSTQSNGHRNWMAAQSFRGERGKLVLLPDAQGSVAAVVVGLGKPNPGEGLNLWHGGGVAERVPEGTYSLSAQVSVQDAAQFALGWEYAQYRFERYRKSPERGPRTLQLPAQVDTAEVTRLNAGCSLARDLINTPAGDMTPQVLAQTAVDLAAQYGATCRHYVGDELLSNNFPAVHAVGRAAAVPPQLVDFEWGDASHPKVSLVGKGVCFDTGGLDIKPPSSMLLMKKDMGGAACVLALARCVMDAKLPVRLRVIIPAVENAIAGNAFRPGDVLATRAGLSVEVGNTDAEGRLILCDGLTLADVDAPDLLIDMSTLTGAARVALGPELPAVFTDDAQLAASLLASGNQVADPFWQLPLWAGYEDELSSKIADLNNVSSSGFSGAIIAGLYLKRFVSKAKQWVHFDLYAWNGKERPGRAAGAEPQCVRALYQYLQTRFAK